MSMFFRLLVALLVAVMVGHFFGLLAGIMAGVLEFTNPVWPCRDPEWRKD
jgi:hypothetical protein